jgi:hypothetical protein
VVHFFHSASKRRKNPAHLTRTGHWSKCGTTALLYTVLGNCNPRTHLARNGRVVPRWPVSVRKGIGHCLMGVQRVQPHSRFGPSATCRGFHHEKVCAASRLTVPSPYCKRSAQRRTESLSGLSARGKAGAVRPKTGVMFHTRVTSAGAYCCKRFGERCESGRQTAARWVSP